MIWQDYILAIIGIMFSIALIPAIRSNEKPLFVTCFINGIFLVLASICYASLFLLWASITSAITAICWWILAIQKLRAK